MNKSLSVHRLAMLAENEAVFREYNEGVQKGLDELKKVAAEEDQQYLAQEINSPLHFYCECADENCRERIQLTPKEYKEVHANRSRFIVVAGHNVAALEKVVGRELEYWVVEKFIKPPNTAKKLNATPVDNS
ncbi:MAG: hypothetical protein ACREGA_03430 [Candidatus Saccharimonadales bacterium]